MKSFLVALLVIILMGVLAIQSFRSWFGQAVFIAPTPAFIAPPEAGGGAPRKTPVPAGTSSDPNGFIGPSGPPHIQGPPGPPPGS